MSVIKSCSHISGKCPDYQLDYCNSLYRGLSQGNLRKSTVCTKHSLCLCWCMFFLCFLRKWPHKKVKTQDSVFFYFLFFSFSLLSFSLLYYSHSSHFGGKINHYNMVCDQFWSLCHCCVSVATTWFVFLQKCL